MNLFTGKCAIACGTLIMILFVALPQSHAQSQDLLAHWRFNEGSGCVAGDSSGSGRQGLLEPSCALNSPTWIGNGIQGSALEFDGDDDYVGVDDTAGVFDFNAPFTISLWAKAYSLTPKDGGIGEWACWWERIGLMGKGISGEEWPAWNLYAVDPSCQFGGKIAFIFREQEGYAYSDQSMIVGQWHHIAVTWGGNGTPVRMYLDGALQSNTSGPYTATSHGSMDPVYVGCAAYGDDASPKWHFDGIVDDIKVFPRKLSESEINNEYKKFQYSRWSFDEETGSLAYDTGRNGLHGELINTPTRLDSDVIRGRALSFNGTDDYLRVDDSHAKLDLSSAFTISLWAKAWDLSPRGEGFLPQTYGLMGKGRNSISEGGYSEWPTWNLFAKGGTVDGNSIRFTYGEHDAEVSSIQPMEPDKWHHIVVTWGGAGNHVLLYVNGVLQDESAEPYEAESIGSTDALYIGCASGDHNTPSWHFNGIIDEVELYDRRLSPVEIIDKYCMIGARWAFEESDGCLVLDGSPNAHDGMLMPNCPITSPKRIQEHIVGQAMIFEPGEYIAVADNESDFEFRTPFTLSLWAKAVSFQENQHAALVCKRDESGWPVWTLFAKYTNIDDQLVFMFGEESCLVQSGLEMEPGEWYHIAISWGGGTNKVRMYINGNAAAESAQSPSGLLPSGGDINVGSGAECYDPPQWHFNGAIDEVMIYHRELSHDEIRWHSALRRIGPLAKSPWLLLSGEEFIGHEEELVDDLAREGIKQIILRAEEWGIPGAPDYGDLKELYVRAHQHDIKIHAFVLNNYKGWTTYRSLSPHGGVEFNQQFIDALVDYNKVCERDSEKIDGIVIQYEGAGDTDTMLSFFRNLHVPPDLYFTLWSWVTHCEKEGVLTETHLDGVMPESFITFGWGCGNIAYREGMPIHDSYDFYRSWTKRAFYNMGPEGYLLWSGPNCEAYIKLSRSYSGPLWLHPEFSIGHIEDLDDEGHYGAFNPNNPYGIPMLSSSEEFSFHGAWYCNESGVSVYRFEKNDDPEHWYDVRESGVICTRRSTIKSQRGADEVGCGDSFIGMERALFDEGALPDDNVYPEPDTRIEVISWDNGMATIRVKLINNNPEEAIVGDDRSSGVYLELVGEGCFLLAEHGDFHSIQMYDGSRTPMGEPVLPGESVPEDAKIMELRRAFFLPGQHTVTSGDIRIEAPFTLYYRSWMTDKDSTFEDIGLNPIPLVIGSIRNVALTAVNRPEPPGAGTITWTFYVMEGAEERTLGTFTLTNGEPSYAKGLDTAPAPMRVRVAMSGGGYVPADFLLAITCEDGSVIHVHYPWAKTQREMYVAIDGSTHYDQALANCAQSAWAPHYISRDPIDIPYHNPDKFLKNEYAAHVFSYPEQLCGAWYWTWRQEEQNDTVLYIANTTSAVVSGTVTLTNLDGQVSPPVDFTIAPHGVVSRGFFEYFPPGFECGSIRVSHDGAAGALVAHAYIFYNGQMQYGYNLEPVHATAGPLYGAWYWTWRQEEQNDTVLYIANTTSAVVNGTVTLTNLDGQVSPPVDFTIAPHGVVSRGFFEYFPPGFDCGSIRVSHDGATGALVAHAYIFYNGQMQYGYNLEPAQ
ncbi:MAG: LamG domain-containing protein [bacterium]|nr:LamG domain-containing protein [bacterium]